MSFYVWDTPEVAKYFGKDKYCKGCVYTTVDGINFIYHHATYLNGFARKLKEISVEYKLHHVHGFIPANSKLFKEDINKEQKEKLMNQPVEKVFEVGDKCVIKNIDSKFYVYEEATENFVDKEVTIMSKFEIPYVTPESGLKMVSVMNEYGQCTCFREEMYYPIKTEKEKAIEEIVDIVCSKGFLSKNGTVSWEIANQIYEAGYRKVGE